MSEMNQQPANNTSGYDYTPISMWGYFGYQILFAIPCIGLICLIIFAFSKNINVRNFARSYFCVLILALIAIAIFVMLGGMAAIAGL